MADIVGEIVKGITQGTLEWTKEQFQEVARRIDNRDIAFIEDKPTADRIQKQEGTSEYRLLTQFVPKGYLRVLVKLGLTLRIMENNSEEVTSFKNIIYDQFGTNGLRIAELVQMGIASQLLTHLVKIYKSPKDVQIRLLSFFDQVVQLFIWVAKEDLKAYKRISEVVKSKVETNPSQMAIVCGRGEKAVQVVLKILKDVKGDPRHYVVETQQQGYQLSGFVFAPEVRAKVASRWDAFTSES
nr:hypothetical protein [Ferrimicrobium acidiphilum]